LLDGCPFAPGTSGNVATEDLVYLFNELGLKTGIDLQKVFEAADLASDILGARIGGRLSAWLRAVRA
jgi:hydroxymethylglutaryl-CoA lyase